MSKIFCRLLRSRIPFILLLGCTNLNYDYAAMGLGCRNLVMRCCMLKYSKSTWIILFSYGYVYVQICK